MDVEGNRTRWSCTKAEAYCIGPYLVGKEDKVGWE